MKNLPTLPNDSSFTVQFSISVSKTRAILLFTIKIIEMFELHASIPGMLSDEYQMTIPLKFLIICLTIFLLVHRKSLKKKKGIFEFYRNYKFYSVFSLTWPASIQKKAFT